MSVVLVQLLLCIALLACPSHLDSCLCSAGAKQSWLHVSWLGTAKMFSKVYSEPRSGSRTRINWIRQLLSSFAAFRNLSENSACNQVQSPNFFIVYNYKVPKSYMLALLTYKCQIKQLFYATPITCCLLFYFKQIACLFSFDLKALCTLGIQQRYMRFWRLAVYGGHRCIPATCSLSNYIRV